MHNYDVVPVCACIRTYVCVDVCTCMCVCAHGVWCVHVCVLMHCSLTHSLSVLGEVESDITSKNITSIYERDEGGNMEGIYNSSLLILHSYVHWLCLYNTGNRIQ